MPDQQSDTPPSEQPSNELLKAGQLLHQAGKLEDAQQLYQLVLEMEPYNPQPYHMLGLLALEIKQFDTARDLIQAAIARNAQQPGFHRDLATALWQLDERDTAIVHYQQALALAPNDMEIYHQLGLRLADANRCQEAVPVLEKAIVMGARTSPVFAALAQCFLTLERYNEATNMAIAAVKLDPENLQGLRVLARAWFAVGQYKNAYDAGEHLLSKSRDNIEDILFLARIYTDSGQPRAGLALAQKALTIDPTNEDAIEYFIAANIMMGRWETALDILDQILAHKPGHAAFTIMKVVILERKGEYEEAFRLIKPLVEKVNISSSVLLTYALLAPRFGEQKKAQKLLEALLAKDTVLFNTRLETLTQLASLYKDQGNYDKAFNAFAEVNALKPHFYDDQKHEALINRIIACFTPERLQKTPKATHSPSRPIFIVGMPRSGTSLTEKILARHPEVAAGGELGHIRFLANSELPAILKTEQVFPDYLEALSEDALNQAARIYLEQIDVLTLNQEIYVTDKMPMNFIYLGLIQLLFPTARIIHCTRDPMATGLSCFMVNFQSAEEMGFSQDLNTIGSYYQRYEKLMQHWHKVLPCPIYDLSYEALVSDPETEIRKLLDFCGLPWHPDCLEPHKSKDTVKTASYNQVRRPINTGSIDSWKRYEKQLQPLKEALKVGDRD